jgi:cellobiose-specific phosphotransferase system component IIC
MMMSNLNQVIFGLPPVMEAIMYVPWILAVLLIGVLLGAVFAWLRKYWTLTGRIFYTVLALAAIAHIWFLSYWNLL